MAEPIPMCVVLERLDMARTPVRENLVYKTVDGQPLHADVYYPPDNDSDAPLPAVIMAGGDATDTRTMAANLCWGQLIASSGVIAVTFDHRATDHFAHAREAESDVADLVAYVRREARELELNPDRLAIFACSGGTAAALRGALRDVPPFVRCLVAYYGVMHLEHMLDDTVPPEKRALLGEYSLSRYLAAPPRPLPPMLVVRAGRDTPQISQSTDHFMAEALAHNVPVELINYADGRHGFDVLDDTDTSRRIIQYTLDFFSTHLGAR